MKTNGAPSADEMFRALVERDTTYDGIFYTAVTTTGIFCRPSCPARTPDRKNVEFYASTRDALVAGYRPCKRCRPLEPPGQAPAWLRGLLEELEDRPGQRWRDADLRERGLDPGRVRRWFKTNHGMTFHAYQRARRLGGALERLGHGADATRTAYEHGYESVSGFSEAVRRLTGQTPGRSRDSTVVHLTRIATPLGPMLAGATRDALCLLEFTDRRMLETQLKRLDRRLHCVFVPGRNEVLEQAEHELRRYFDGALTDFSVPLHAPGTEFQQRVWEGLRRIPYGATRSYSEQAERIGQPTAVRAVARANGDNRIAIIIPCHRVIGRDGRLSGYGGGVWRKRFLLELERRVSEGGDRRNGNERGV